MMILLWNMMVSIWNIVILPWPNGDLINDAKLEAPNICKIYVKVM